MLRLSGAIRPAAFVPVVRPVPALVPVLVPALVLVLLSGCSTSPPRSRQPSVAPPTPIAQLNTAQMDVHRIPFCDLLPRRAVTAALGQRAATHDAWRDGGSSPFVGGAGDRAQEFGCRFGAGPAAAAAWVFASPVQPSFAEKVIADASRQQRCTQKGAAAFGSPSEDQVCRLPGDRLRVRHAGLFGQTWLTCQVSAPLPRLQVTRRADAWCVQVANALNTNR